MDRNAALKRTMARAALKRAMARARKARDNDGGGGGGYTGPSPGDLVQRPAPAGPQPARVVSRRDMPSIAHAMRCSDADANIASKDARSIKEMARLLTAAYHRRGETVDQRIERMRALEHRDHTLVHHVKQATKSYKADTDPDRTFENHLERQLQKATLQKSDRARALALGAFSGDADVVADVAVNPVLQAALGIPLAEDAEATRVRDHMLASIQTTSSMDNVRAFLSIANRTFGTMIMRYNTRANTFTAAAYRGPDTVDPRAPHPQIQFEFGDETRRRAMTDDEKARLKDAFAFDSNDYPTWVVSGGDRMHEISMRSDDPTAVAAQNEREIKQRAAAAARAAKDATKDAADAAARAAPRGGKTKAREAVMNDRREADREAGKEIVEAARLNAEVAVIEAQHDGEEAMIELTRNVATMGLADDGKRVIRSEERVQVQARDAERKTRVGAGTANRHFDRSIRRPFVIKPRRPLAPPRKVPKKEPEPDGDND